MASWRPSLLGSLLGSQTQAAKLLRELSSHKSWFQHVRACPLPRFLSLSFGLQAPQQNKKSTVAAALALGLSLFGVLVTSNKCLSTSNKCLTSSNKKLLETILMLVHYVNSFLLLLVRHLLLVARHSVPSSLLLALFLLRKFRTKVKGSQSRTTRRAVLVRLTTRSLSDLLRPDSKNFCVSNLGFGGSGSVCRWIRFEFLNLSLAHLRNS